MHARCRHLTPNLCPPPGAVALENPSFHLSTQTSLPTLHLSILFLFLLSSFHLRWVTSSLTIRKTDPRTRAPILLHGCQMPGLFHHHDCLLACPDRCDLRRLLHRALSTHRRQGQVNRGLQFPAEVDFDAAGLHIAGGKNTWELDGWL